MRALKIVGPSKAEIQEVAEPEIGIGQVKVTVERAGICGRVTEIGSATGSRCRRSARDRS